MRFSSLPLSVSSSFDSIFRTRKECVLKLPRILVYCLARLGLAWLVFLVLLLLLLVFLAVVVVVVVIVGVVVVCVLG